MEVKVDWLLKYWPLLLVVWTSVLSVLGFFLHRTYAKRDDHIALKNDVALIKQQITDFPSDKDIHQLDLKIEGLRGDIKGLQPDLIAVRKLADILLENELINSKGSK